MNSNLPPSSQSSAPMTLRWIPLPVPLQEASKKTMVVPITAPNSSPCRRCLTDALPGDTVLLTSYSPFTPSVTSDRSPYTSPGPIFVHSEPVCQAYSGAEMPQQMRGRLLSLRAYTEDDLMVEGVVAKGEDAEIRAKELLGLDGVRYLNLHYAGPGCFAARVERV